jgi:hypothetical protein
MPIDPGTATALITAAVAVGILKGIDLLVWFIKRRNGTHQAFSRLDCMQGQIHVKRAIRQDLNGLRGDLKAGIGEIKGLMQRHEDTWHNKEPSMPPHPGPFG